MPTAKLKTRFIAFFIDSLLILVIAYFYLKSSLRETDKITLFLSASFFSFLYGTLLDASPLKGTLGKFLLGLEVVNLQGKKINLSTSLYRNGIKTLMIDLCFIGFIFFMFSFKSKTLQDMLTKTLVVKKLKNQKADDFSHPLYEKTKNSNQLDL